MKQFDPTKDHHPILIYSAFGLGKTALLGLIVDRVLQEGQKARLVTAEHYNVLQKYIDDGRVEVWKVNTRDHPFETLRAAADGYWPADSSDPTSPLVPPTAETWQRYPVRMFEGIATIALYIAGAYVVGGLTQRAESERIGFEKEYIQFDDGSESVAGLTWTHFNMTQKEVTEAIRRSQKRPGYSIWTSHEDLTKSKRQMGPEVIGTALTAGIGREFADVLHIVGVANDVTDTTGEVRRYLERRLYLKEHYAPGLPIPYQAKNSVGVASQATVPDYLRMSQDGAPMLDVAERLFKVWGR